jgi:hypothetical protein
MSCGLHYQHVAIISDATIWSTTLDSGWKTTLLTSVFFLLTFVFLSPHGSALMAFADVDVDSCYPPPPSHSPTLEPSIMLLLKASFML